jgi:hypothetical protein
MKKLNILFISNSVSKTGAPKMLELLLNYIKKHKADKYTVYVASVLESEIKVEDKTYWERNYNCFFLRPVYNINELKTSEVPILFNLIDIDIVYGNCTCTLPYLYLFKKCNSNIKTILHLHEHANGFQMSRMKFGEYTESLFHHVDEFITVCKYQISALQQFNIPLKKQLHVSEMIDVDVIEQLVSTNPPFNIKQKVRIIGCGTGGSRKGIDRFIEISNRFDPNIFEFIWIGDVPVKDDKVFLEGHGVFEDYHVDIGNVKFIGQISVPSTYFTNSNIFLMLSRQDPCPLVVLEALYMGMFVVTIEESGDSHIYCTQYDEILKKYDADDVFTSINRILEKRKDLNIINEKRNYYKILKNIVSPNIVSDKIIKLIENDYPIVTIKNFNDFEGENNSVVWTKDTSTITFNKPCKKLDLKIQNTFQTAHTIDFVFDTKVKSLLIPPDVFHYDVSFDISNVKTVTINSKVYPCTEDKRVLGTHLLSMKVDGVIIDKNIFKSIDVKSEYHDENVNYSPFNKSDKIVFACIDGTSGYGVLARETVLNLRNSGYKVNYLPFVFEKSLGGHNQDLLLNDFDESQATCYILNFPPHILEYVYNYLLGGRCKGKKTISFPLWESEYIKKEYVDQINRFSSSVIVSSEWNKNTMRQCGVIKDIQVMYHKPILPPLRTKNEVINFVYQNSKVFGQPKDLITTKNFYSIGQWTCRKGITEVLESFCQSFTNNDNTALILKTHYVSHDETSVTTCVDRINDILKRYPNHPTIYYIYVNLLDVDMMNIHFCGDVYVSATKSEGIGLGAITASAYNKPVIITKYGAQYEYLKNDPNVKFVSYTLHPAKDDLSFNLDLSNQLWAHPDISDMVDKMKMVYKL